MPKRCIMISMKNYIRSSLLNCQEILWKEKQEVASDELAHKTISIVLNSKHSNVWKFWLIKLKSGLQNQFQKSHTLNNRRKK